MFIGLVGHILFLKEVDLLLDYDNYSFRFCFKYSSGLDIEY